ncbi:MAG TPA: undecaprenyl-diphosphate phosphatase, partial [Tepiditoga sp.]|nr:undecaprenyl-diphosphate phosphatase [Tepiditoga sp.]
GFLLNDFFEQVFSSVKYVGIFLAVTGLLMLFSDRLNKNRKDIFTLSYTEALFIGLIQAVAILPGISRSGSTLFAALLFGMKKEDAVKYSFLMSLPVTFGAGILEMQKGVFNSWHYIGMAAAFLSGLFGLYLLRKTVINGKTKYFAFYCFAISAVTLIFL